jgi:hypothetical protein
VIHIRKFKVEKNKTITKKAFDDKFEYKFNRETDVVPKKVNRVMAIIFKEDKSSKILFVKSSNKNFDFIHNGHLYFIEPTSIHNCDNGQRIALYMEGISTPISHANVEKELKTVKYTDLAGNLKTKVIIKIKGLKYDSRILQIFTDRKFAEVFTKVGIDKWAFYTFIALVVLIALSVSNVIVSYMRV